MRMPANDDVESASSGIQVETTQVVYHEYGYIADLYGLRFRKLARPHIPVRIAPDGMHGSHGLQSLQDLRPADIARMENQLDPRQRRQGLRSQQSVCISDNSYLCLFRLDVLCRLSAV